MLFELSTSLLIVASYFGLDGVVDSTLQQDKQNRLNRESPEITRTALSWAIREGHDRVVRSLLNRVPNWQVKLRDKFHSPITTIVNQKDARGRTPLWWAVGGGNLEIVRQLVEKGARIRDRDNDEETPLLRAIESGNAEVVNFLLSCDAGSAVKSEQLKTHDREGRTLIGKTVIAARWQTDSVAILRLLIDHGADVNASDKNGTTALMHALGFGTPEIVKLLLDHGADVNTSDMHGTSVLERATFRMPEVVKLFLDHGANIKAFGRTRDTALVAASSNGKLETIKLLLDRGANIEAFGRFGDTALIAASSSGKLETVKLLLDHGADVNAQGTSEETALFCALRAHDHSIAKILTDNGADVT